MLVCLEGGYDLDALVESVGATIEALTDSREPRAAPAAGGAVHRSGAPILAGL